MHYMSRWFVGSPRSKRWGLDIEIRAKTTRFFNPSDICSIGRVCISFRTPCAPNLPRHSCSVTFLLPSVVVTPSSYLSAKNSRGLLQRARLRRSVGCTRLYASDCATQYTRPLPLIYRAPTPGYVEFPASLGPPKAIQLS